MLGLGLVDGLRYVAAGILVYATAFALYVHSGVALKKIEKDADRDYWLSAREAKDYGLIDEVLSKRDK